MQEKGTGSIRSDVRRGDGTKRRRRLVRSILQPHIRLRDGACLGKHSDTRV